jgi:hypothetical protein
MTDHAAAVEAIRKRVKGDEAWTVGTLYDDCVTLLRAYEAVVHENVGLKHTLELWDHECGGRSPREVVAQAVRAEREKHTFPLCEDSGHAICYQCAAAVRGPQP